MDTQASIQLEESTSIVCVTTLSEKPRKAYQKLLNIFEDDPRLTLHIRADIQLLAQVSIINL